MARCHIDRMRRRGAGGGWRVVGGRGAHTCCRQCGGAGYCGSRSSARVQGLACGGCGAACGPRVWHSCRCRRLRLRRRRLLCQPWRLGPRRRLLAESGADGRAAFAACCNLRFFNFLPCAAPTAVPAGAPAAGAACTAATDGAACTAAMRRAAAVAQRVSSVISFSAAPPPDRAPAPAARSAAVAAAGTSSPVTAGPAAARRRPRRSGSAPVLKGSCTVLWSRRSN